jgi:hypothetical protein
MIKITSNYSKEIVVMNDIHVQDMHKHFQLILKGIAAQTKEEQSSSKCNATRISLERIKAYITFEKAK